MIIVFLVFLILIYLNKKEILDTHLKEYDVVIINDSLFEEIYNLLKIFVMFVVIL